MPVTTISDLKWKREKLEEDIAWKRREQVTAATEYERDRATEALPALLHEYFIVGEEIRQALSQRSRKYGSVVRFMLVGAALIGFGYLLVKGS